MFESKPIMSITYQALSDFLINNKNVNEFFEFVKAKLAPNNSSFELYRQQINQFVKNHNFRWNKKSKGRKELFYKNYGTWLENEFTLEKPSINTKRLKPFEECSVRTKRRRMEEVRQNRNPEEIKGAYIAMVRDDNVVDAEIISNLSKVDLETKDHILKVIRGEVLPVTKYTDNEALALMVDLKLSKPKYEQLRSQNKHRNVDILPPYYRVVEAKAACYPPKEFITLSDFGAEVELQQLLDHTIERLIQTSDQNLIREINEPKLHVTYKWGMDGASGQSSYKQIYNNNSDNCSDDASVFMISLLPLQISSNENIIWTNPLPSSTKFCRPIKFKFMKETKDNSIKEYQFMEEKIRKLKDSLIVCDNKTIHVTHKLYSTMVDGKMIDDLTDNKSHSTCNICRATTSEMNNLDKLKPKELIESNYAFGISSLHCWIRFMECILHISYKLKIKKWAAYSDSDKQSVKDEKLKLQSIFKREKGLNIDIVKPGSGTSNDGNTARRFFRDSKFTAETTGIDERLIIRFRVILIAMSSGEKIDVYKFRIYAKETEELYKSLYNWYNMPTSVHKVLIHGASIINFFNLPIGFYSEEAQEARNKDFRHIREFQSRKSSRENTNEDIVHWLLITSDPLISSMRATAPKKHLEFDQEVSDLFESE